MGQTKLQIVNYGLRLALEAELVSLTGNVRADAVNSVFDISREQMLSIFPWGCATKWYQLNPAGVQPVFGFANYFELPEGFVKLWELSDETADWEIQGELDVSYLACDAADTDTLYGFMTIDPFVVQTETDDVYGNWPIWATDCFSWQLAINICSRISGKEDRLQYLTRQFEQLEKKRFVAREFGHSKRTNRKRSIGFMDRINRGYPEDTRPK